MMGKTTFITTIRQSLEIEYEQLYPNLGHSQIQRMVDKELKRQLMESYSSSKIVKEQTSLQKILKLEREDRRKFRQFHPELREEVFIGEVDKFLYHGLRFQNQLDKFENILREGKILAGNYLRDYWPYDDNCNEGKYVSLLEFDPDYQLQYDTFIKPNISFVISSFVDAVETIYVSYDLWEEIVKCCPDHHNRYSYARGEWQVKDFVSLDMVRAIGVPYLYLVKKGQSQLAEEYFKKITIVLKEYHYQIPIVDTSNYNRALGNNFSLGSSNAPYRRSRLK